MAKARVARARPLHLMALILTMPGAALAQSSTTGTTDPGDAPALEDIIVTAQRRAENLQDVPVATTALAAEALARANITSTADLAQLAPNLQINGSFELLPKITIRGVGTNDFAQNMAAAVATNVDEVYIGLATGQTLQLFDLERVEVLRGPQGTLYGKNATGGAINYYTRQPDKSDLGGYITATVGSFEQLDIEGAVNVPLGESAAARLSFLSRDRDGYWKNLLDGSRGRFLNAKAARLQFSAEPSDRVKILIKAHVGEIDTDSVHRQAIGVLDPAVPGLELIGGVDVAGYSAPRQANVGEQDSDTFERADEHGIMGRVSVDLGFADLTSITAYGRVEREALDDADGGRFKLIRNFYGSDSDFVSQEIRLGEARGRFSWIVGGHFLREKHDVETVLSFFECTLAADCTIRRQTPPAVIPPGRVGVTGYPPGNVFPGGPLAGVPIATRVTLSYVQKNVSYAAFGDATYQVSDTFSITGGLRFTWEEKEIDATSLSRLIARPEVTSPFFPGYGLFEGSKSWDNLSGRIVLQYKPQEGQLYYVNAGTGFRSGNWNGLAFNSRAIVERPVDPEKLKNIEVGAKTEWFDRRLRANLALFYSQYDDLQVAVFLNSASVLANAANAEIWGGEAEITAAITESFQARLAVGYTNAKYKRFDDGRGNDLSGKTLVNSPEWTVSASADYSRHIGGDWRLGLGADMRYQSQTFFTVFNFAHLGQRPYALFDLRAELVNKASGLRLAAFVENVFDKDYRTDGNQIRAPFGVDIVAWGRPRMWGLSASYSF